MRGFELSAEGMRIILLLWLFLVMVLLLFLVIGQSVRKDNSLGHKSDTVFFCLLFIMCIFWRTQKQALRDGYIDRVSWFIAAVGLLYALLRFIWLKRHRSETLSRDTIRESLDNLPMGVAFFDKTGFPVLINRRMHELGRELYGTEIQSLNELEQGLFHPASTVRVVSREPAVYEFSSGSVWKYSSETVKVCCGQAFL